MVRRWIGVAIKAVLFLIIAIGVFGQAVHYLWNWLMPSLFRLPAITFWQAVGLLALSWMLFGGMRGMRGRGWGHRGQWRGRMQERWEKMTPEEREKFRGRMRDYCGPVAADAQPKA
ncbi:MAG: hypothetical protein WAK91_14020 [Candidatus Acidiferrales bacterium]|jgi:hypothetical protein